MPSCSTLDDFFGIILNGGVLQSKNYIADFAGVFLEIFRFPKVGGGLLTKITLQEKYIFDIKCASAIASL